MHSTSHYSGKGNNVPQQRRRHIAVFIGAGDTILAVSGLPFGSPLVQQIHGNLYLNVSVLVRNSGHGGVKGICLATHLASGDRKVGGKRVLVCLAGHGFYHCQLLSVRHAFHLLSLSGFLGLSGFLSFLAGLLDNRNGIFLGQVELGNDFLAGEGYGVVESINNYRTHHHRGAFQFTPSNHLVLCGKAYVTEVISLPHIHFSVRNIEHGEPP
nr:MAG TPA: hypothetical protein [Caudoviricetes sp.]